MSDLRIGVVGAGIIGRTHVATIAKTPGMTLAGIVDPFADASLAAALGTTLYADHAGLLDAGIDGVIVATPNETHVPIATTYLRAGIPVLLEKPIANTIAEALELVAAETSLGVPLLVGHHRRHNPIIKTAAAAIAAGRIGGLVNASVLYLVRKNDSYFDVNWRQQPGIGGPLLINVIHEIDLLRSFFGDVAEVAAMQSNDARGLAVEDTAGLLLRFAKGGYATITVSDAAASPWAWDITAGDNPERFPANPTQSHFFAGTRASLSLPDLSLWEADDTPDWTVPMRRQILAHDDGDAYVAQLLHFGAVIRGEAAPLVSAREATKNLATILAAQAAASSGRTVSVTSISGASE